MICTYLFLIVSCFLFLAPLGWSSPNVNIYPVHCLLLIGWLKRFMIFWWQLPILTLSGSSNILLYTESTGWSSQAFNPDSSFLWHSFPVRIFRLIIALNPVLVQLPTSVLNPQADYLKLLILTLLFVTCPASLFGFTGWLSQILNFSLFWLTQYHSLVLFKKCQADQSFKSCPSLAL